jgi:hypothetical protein
MKFIQAVILPIIAALLLTACGGAREIRITEGNQTRDASPTGTAFLTGQAAIVHVNERARVATINNGNAFADGAFLIATDRQGNKAGALKALPLRGEDLRMADVLEGLPAINNLVRLADPSEAARLGKLYPDSEE